MSYLRNRSETRWLSDDEWACTRHLPMSRYPASVKECLLSCGNVRPEKPKKAKKAKPQRVRTAETLTKKAPKVTVVPAKTQEVWKDFNKVPPEDLMTLRIKDLRQYAVHVLHIAGAAHIRGGKVKLVERIVEERKAS